MVVLARIVCICMLAAVVLGCVEPEPEATSGMGRPVSGGPAVQEAPEQFLTKERPKLPPPPPIGD
jgi:hypothetical protein